MTLVAEGKQMPALIVTEHGCKLQTRSSCKYIVLPPDEMFLAFNSQHGHVDPTVYLNSHSVKAISVLDVMLRDNN